MAQNESNREFTFLAGPMSHANALLERLGARSELLLVAAAGIAALVLLAAVTWSSGIMAFAAVLAYVLVRSAERPGSTTAASRQAGDKDRGAERQAIVDGIPEPAWMLDPDSVVICVNRYAREIFPNLRTGINISAAVRNPDVIEAVARAVSSNTIQTATLHERVPIERRLSAVVAPLKLDTAQRGGPAVLITLRDLTEQDRLAQMRADFVANASHELRTPLASLRGFVETLQGPAKNDPTARERFLGIMSAQADRMTRLIDDLLSLSRVEMRQHVAPTAIVDLAGICSQAIQGLEPQANEARITLAFQAGSQPFRVRGDRDELLQVVQNLVQNAIKYGREGGRVEVRIGREEAPVGGGFGRVSVSVIDDGFGIAAEHIPRLTERFYRVNAAQSRDKGGTGLGLAIVKHIVTRHGGVLSIASRVGSGSTFTFTLNGIHL